MSREWGADLAVFPGSAFSRRFESGIRGVLGCNLMGRAALKQQEHVCTRGMIIDYERSGSWMVLEFWRN